MCRPCSATAFSDGRGDRDARTAPSPGTAHKSPRPGPREPASADGLALKAPISMIRQKLQTSRRFEQLLADGGERIETVDIARQLADDSARQAGKAARDFIEVLPLLSLAREIKAAGQP